MQTPIHLLQTPEKLNHHRQPNQDLTLVTFSRKKSRVWNKKCLDQQQMHHYRTSTLHILYILMRFQFRFCFVLFFHSNWLALHEMQEALAYHSIFLNWNIPMAQGYRGNMRNVNCVIVNAVAFQVTKVSKVTVSTELKCYSVCLPFIHGLT